MKLYWNPCVPPALVLKAILDLSGTKYECVLINPMTGETRTEEYKERVTLLQTIPALTDGDEVKLAETNAIIRYLIRSGQIKPDLVPKKED